MHTVPIVRESHMAGFHIGCHILQQIILTDIIILHHPQLKQDLTIGDSTGVIKLTLWE